jgi:nitroreductase
MNMKDHRCHDNATILSQLLKDRFSCRAFLSQPVSRDVITRLLDMAQNAPSWCNSQPWQLHITSGEATERFRVGLFQHAIQMRDQTSGVPMDPDLPFPTRYTGIYKERQREVGWQLYESVGVAHGDREASGRQMMENFRLFDAPHALVLTSERDLGVYGAVDCGAYLACLLLAAESLGLAAIAQAAIAGCAPFVRSFFGLPDNRVVLLGLSLGYADKAHPANGFRSRRAPIADVVHWVEQ